MNTKQFSNRDNLLIGALLATGLLMSVVAAALAPIVPAESAEAPVATVAPSAIVPAAMQPVLIEPAIIVTAPRLTPATKTAKSRRNAGTTA